MIRPRLHSSAVDEAMILVQQGDRRAFAVVYDQVADRVFGVIRRVLRDRAMSEEVAQEVFVEVWRSAQRFDPDRASAVTWIVTIARRRAIDRVRREQAMRDRVESYASRAIDREVDVADEVAESIEARRVRAAVDELPDDQREVIRLAFLEGCTHSDLAERLSIPLGTVKGRVRGGLVKLRRRLGES